MKSGWVLLFLLLAGAVRADEIQVTGKTRKGSFQGFGNSRFEFMTDTGRFIKEHSGRVMKLTLESPQNVAYTTADNPKEQTAKLKGYEKKKFVLTTKDGKEVQVALAKMKAVEMLGEDVPAGAGGEGFDTSNRYPIPRINVDTLGGGGALTPAQQTALAQFKESKQAYDDFLARSSEMVGQMDKLTGAKREEMLNQLRVRKNEEQPLKNKLVAAFKALTAQFAE